MVAPEHVGAITNVRGATASLKLHSIWTTQWGADHVPGVYKRGPLIGRSSAQPNPMLTGETDNEVKRASVDSEAV
jgi:hypothetical protein